jgi:hypothetical protein
MATAGASALAFLIVTAKLLKSMPPSSSPIGGHDDVVHQRGHDLAERAADDDADRHVHDVAAHGEILELLDQ